MKVDQSVNTTLLLCPKCFDQAFPTVVNNKGLVVLRQCRLCGHQAYAENFITLDTGNKLQQENNLIKPTSGTEPEEK